MSRLAIAAVSVCLLGGSAYGQGQVVSFYQVTRDDEPFFIVPAGGYVLTDMISSSGNSFVLTILEGPLGNQVTKGSFEFTPVASTYNSYHLNSGIRLTAGSEVFLSAGFSNRLTISGYIPDPPSALIPAIGNVGLGIMIASLIAAAGWVISRRTGFGRVA